jgi:hypothetical protein
MPEFDTNNNGYSELQPQYSTSHGQQQEQRYHCLCEQYGHSRSSYIGCPHYQPRPPPPGDSDEPEPLPRPQPTGGYGFGSPRLQNRLAKAFTYTEHRKRHSCSRLSFHQVQFTSLQIPTTTFATCDWNDLPFRDILNAFETRLDIEFQISRIFLCKICKHLGGARNWWQSVLCGRLLKVIVVRCDQITIAFDGKTLSIRQNIVYGSVQALDRELFKVTWLPRQLQGTWQDWYGSMSQKTKMTNKATMPSTWC